MRLLPETKNKSLLAAIIVLVFCMLGLCALMLKNGTVESIFIALVFVLPNAIGLWCLKEASRKITSVMIMFLVIMAPIGIINPFAAMDEVGKTPQDAWKLSVIIYPIVAIGLLLVHVLGKHKHEFTKLHIKNRNT